MILADRGFHRASFIAWLVRQHLHYVVRSGRALHNRRGSTLKLGEEGLKIGELRFMEGVRYGLYHGRPRELTINMAPMLEDLSSQSRAKNLRSPGTWLRAQEPRWPPPGTGSEAG